jgi:hypothetical protein
MLVDGVTINDGGDGPVGLCAALICDDKSIAGIASKATDAIWPVAIMVSQSASRGGGAQMSNVFLRK